MKTNTTSTGISLAQNMTDVEVIGTVEREINGFNKSGALVRVAGCGFIMMFPLQLDLEEVYAAMEREES